MILVQKKLLAQLDFDIKMYIDYDPTKVVFYHNFFFDEYKFVLKIALIPSLHDNDDFWDISNNNGDCSDLKYERFDLTKYVYLLHFA